MDAIDYAETAGQLFALGALMFFGFAALLFIAAAVDSMQAQAGDS